MIILLLILIIIVVFIVLFDLKQRGKHSNDEFPYERRYLLTKNEWQFYKKLKPIADINGYSVLAKVRLADLVSVKKGMNKSDYARYFAKIRAKHIDFILCNPDNLAPVLLIELDDNSHNSESRQTRDHFLDTVLSKSGYVVLHTRGNGDLENDIKNTITPPSDSPEVV